MGYSEVWFREDSLQLQPLSHQRFDSYQVLLGQPRGTHRQDKYYRLHVETTIASFVIQDEHHYQKFKGHKDANEHLVN
eukprot:3534742-Amphidinium_carterae.2